MSLPLVGQVIHWVCATCGTEEWTDQAGHGLVRGRVLPAPPGYTPHTRMHRCRAGALAGMVVPMTRAGVKAHVYAVERGDYVGTELVQKNTAGRPIMAAITEYEDGRTDVAVYAPTAAFRANAQGAQTRRRRR